jgi:hypothetical protein
LARAVLSPGPPAHAFRTQRVTIESNDVCEYSLFQVLTQEDEIVIANSLPDTLSRRYPRRFRTMKRSKSPAQMFSYTVLSLADKNLSLLDSQAAVAVPEPLKSFGDSAFAPLRFRPMAADGTACD